jgi:hypothetical protein
VFGMRALHRPNPIGYRHCLGPGAARPRGVHSPSVCRGPPWPRPTWAATTGGNSQNDSPPPWLVNTRARRSQHEAKRNHVLAPVLTALADSLPKERSKGVASGPPKPRGRGLWSPSPDANGQRIHAARTASAQLPGLQARKSKGPAANSGEACVTSATHSSRPRSRLAPHSSLI